MFPRSIRRAAAILAGCLLLAACKSEPQVPAGGGPYQVEVFGGGYALTKDPAGQPLEIWDLVYPTLEQDEYEWGKMEVESAPVRLVNFREPGEMEEILDDEAWSFGVWGWFGGVVSFGVIKWYMTTELFDVREMRKFERAALTEYLERVGPDDPGLRAAGLDPASHARALEQLRIEPPDELRENVSASLPDLEEKVRSDFADWLDHLEEQSEDLLEESPPEKEALATPAWGRFQAWVDPGSAVPVAHSQAPAVLAGRTTIRAIREAAVLAIAKGEAVPVRIERFGPEGRLALAWVGSPAGELPVAIYDLGVEDDPQMVLLVCDLFLVAPYDDTWASLAANEAAAATITATGMVIGEVVGFPFPFIGLALNTYSSIEPRAPLRSEDLGAAGRGRLLVMARLSCDGPQPGVPAFVTENAGEIGLRIEKWMHEQNRFWPAVRHRAPLLSINRRKLERGARSP